MTFKARGLYASSSKEPRRFRLGLWLAFGAVLVVILVGVTAVSVLGNVSLDHGSRSDSYAGVRTLDLENDTGGDVILTSGGGDEVQLDRTRSGTPFTEPEEDVEANEDSLDVEVSCDGLRFFGSCSMDYEISVPEGTAVTVETVSGRISVENVNGELDLSTTSGTVLVEGNTGDVTVDTTSGLVELDDVEGSVEAESTSGEITATGSGERLEVSSTSGGVDVSGFSARTVEAESTSGNVHIGGGFTTAEASSVSGDVEVDTDTPFELLTLETTSGGIDVRVPEGTYDVTGESTSGSRDLGVDTASGAESRIDASTVSGSLTVQSG